MRRTVLLSGLFAAIMMAQRFEVASVRLVPENKCGATSLGEPGALRFTATNVRLDILVSAAYGIDSDKITGAPKWINNDCYDVTAKPAGDQPLSYKDRQEPLPLLLEERFQLKAHKETKDVDGFALVVGKTGPKLTKTAGGPTKSYLLPERLYLSNLPLAGLTGLLTLAMKQPVSDQTRIEGNYDVDMRFAGLSSQDPNLPSVFSALQDLGLRLEKRKVPIETLVIDRMERLTAEN
jgi:uncharacterized protein (TIGR03435 family)